MALRGEGDPRWVVRERDDGRNVNGWHWEDKDVTAWAQRRMRQLLHASECRGGGVRVEGVKSVDGDATLYNRKGVLKVLYDLKVVGTWGADGGGGDGGGDGGGGGGDDARAHGEFSFELFDDEPDVVATLDAKAAKDSGARAQFMTHVVPLIQRQCRTFIAELHAGAGHDVRALRQARSRKEDDDDSKVTDFEHTRSAHNGGAKAAAARGGDSGDSGDSGALRTVVMSDVFTCSAMDMFLALTDARRLEAITRCRALSEATEGGRLQLLNGVVSGKYVRLEAARQVVMEWKLQSWGDEAAAGLATVHMREEDGKTTVQVRVSGVPNAMASKTEGFWRVQVLQAIKVVMGWGSAAKFM